MDMDMELDNKKDLELELIMEDEKKASTDIKPATIKALVDYFDRNDFFVEHYEGVIDAGIEDKPALAANWNDIPEKIVNYIEEKSGIELIWSDEYARCGECYKAVRIVCDSHFWTPAYIITDNCELLCKHCAQELEIETT